MDTKISSTNETLFGVFQAKSYWDENDNAMLMITIDEKHLLIDVFEAMNAVKVAEALELLTNEFTGTKTSLEALNAKETARLREEDRSNREA